MSPESYIIRIHEIPRATRYRQPCSRVVARVRHVALNIFWFNYIPRIYTSRVYIHIYIYIYEHNRKIRAALPWTVSLEHAGAKRQPFSARSGWYAFACTHVYARDTHVRPRTITRYRTSVHQRIHTRNYIPIHGKHVYARARARSRARTLPCHGALRSVVRPTEGEKGRETFEYKWPSFTIAHPNQPDPEGETFSNNVFATKHVRDRTKQNGASTKKGCEMPLAGPHHNDIRRPLRLYFK